MILLGFNSLLFAQNGCFDYESVTANKNKFLSMDSTFAADKVYLANMKGCQFPDNELTDISGGKFHISQLKGDLVFVNFWFSSCHPCLVESPEIVKLNKKFSKQNVKFLNISSDEKKTLLSFLEKNPMPGVIQTYEFREVLEKKFGCVFGFPMCFLLNRDGKVIEAWSGGGEADEFYKKVEKLITDNL